MFQGLARLSCRSPPATAAAALWCCRDQVRPNVDHAARCLLADWLLLHFSSDFGFQLLKFARFCQLPHWALLLLILPHSSSTLPMMCALSEHGHREILHTSPPSRFYPADLAPVNGASRAAVVHHVAYWERMHAPRQVQTTFGQVQYKLIGRHCRQHEGPESCAVSPLYKSIICSSTV